MGAHSPDVNCKVVHNALTDIASGVTHLHRNELMHRDLAPRNVPATCTVVNSVSFN